MVTNHPMIFRQHVGNANRSVEVVNVGISDVARPNAMTRASNGSVEHSDGDDYCLGNGETMHAMNPCTELRLRYTKIAHTPR